MQVGYAEGITYSVRVHILVQVLAQVQMYGFEENWK